MDRGASPAQPSRTGRGAWLIPVSGSTSGEHSWAPMKAGFPTSLQRLFDKAYRRRCPGGMKKPKKYRKLTFADAQAIRADREQNPALSLDALAGKFAVSAMTIS